jgi:NDP-sugar pyrophosphorylase family protein
VNGDPSAAAVLAEVPVAVLAGGLGTRLRPAIGDAQKVLAEVNGRPFLAYLLDQVARAGFREVVLCVGHHAEAVGAALGASHGPLRLTYSREPTPLGTAGALRLALPRLAGDDVLVLNGDSFCEVDLAALWRWHRSERSEATVVVVEVPDASRYGRVELDAAGRICAFLEKQAGSGAGWINAGIYLLASRRIAGLPADRPLSLERDVFPAWLATGGKHGLRGFRTSGRFIDIGIPRSYADASRFFAAADAADRGSGS